MSVQKQIARSSVHETERRRTQTNRSETERELKNQPNPSNLRQQNLFAWRPILTANFVIPLIFVIGIVVLLAGTFFLKAANSVREFTLNYGDRCAINTTCNLDFDLSEDFKGNVYFYYQLNNFFQNHRRYIKSRSNPQLAGDIKYCCQPYDYQKINGTNIPIAPCGMIANSMFTDSFVVYRYGDGAARNRVPLTHRGVLANMEWKTRFKNPKTNGKDLCTAFEGTVKPPYWRKSPCELDRDHVDNNGFENVDFIVWMQTAALQNTRKLHRLLDREVDATFRDGLPAGSYQLEIENYYEVDMFNGKKQFVISTTSWMGGKNRFLGIAYILTGSVCVLLAAVFSFIHFKFGHSLSKMADVSVNKKH
ncbi:Protein CBR-CHAT-1 [Aphelenchoides besseyi]|nr:Protein CBR-CHAT-1 [Aphelenchoides besseyi]